MCDFPSWVEQDDGTILFLVDQDVIDHGLDWHDAVGHKGGVRRVFPNAGGKNGESFPCPAVIAAAIRGEKMDRLMREGGYMHVHVNPDGKFHREDGPAIECANGDKFWYVNGRLHREDGPAIECANGDKFWYVNGRLHREDGPAVEYADGDKVWYVNGQRHREDGPAVEYANGCRECYVNGYPVRAEVSK